MFHIPNNKEIKFPNISIKGLLKLDFIKILEKEDHYFFHHTDKYILDVKQKSLYNS